MGCNYWGAKVWKPSIGQCYTGRKRAVYKDASVDYFTVSGSQNTAINKEIRLDNLEKAQYEVRITRLTKDSTSTREKTDMYFTGIGEIIYDDLTYPTISLLGIKIKATDQLSGSDPTIKTITSRKQVEVFNEKGISQGLKSLDNPAWVAWDLLTSEQYGANMPYSQLDFTKFNEWALFCDELVGGQKRATFNGVFDYQSNVWECLSKIATVGRAGIIIRGTKYSVIIEKPSLPVQMFTMGNIIEKTFSVHYIGQEELATEVEIQFTNANNGYTKDTVSILVPEYFDQTLHSKKTTISQIGITNRDQAYRAGRCALANNKFIRRLVSFEASVDSIACGVGDVVYVPGWVESGRITGATDTTITLDQQVTLTDGKSYKIILRLQDDTIEEKNIVFTGTQTTDTLTVDVAFANIPQKYDIYTFGETNKEQILLRITSITRKTDQTRKITAIDYNESILIDPTTAVGTSSSISDLRYADILSFTAQEHLEKKKDGSILSFIDFNWDVKSGVDVNYKITGYEYGISAWHSRNIEAITTKSSSYSYNAFSLKEESTYIFNLEVFDSMGHKLATKQIHHKLLGKTTPPAPVTNIQANWANGAIMITWDKNTEVDLASYEIVLQGQIYRTSTNSLRVDTLDIGDYTLNAYAIDTSGNKSTVTDYALHVARPCMIYMIKAAYLIEKAFMDGAMTIYTSLAEPTNPNKYDIWKVSVDNISLDEFEYDTEILTDITWDVGVSTELFKYYTGYGWLLCTTEQTAAIHRMLGQLTTSGITDNEVKVFNIQPYTPYDVNDLWINGTKIYICTTARSSGAFDATDWALHTKEDVTIASKIENIRR